MVCRSMMWGLGALLLGCGLFEPVESETEVTSVPLRDGWRTVLQAGFPTEGADAIESLRVGGHVYEDNFANRGDILVDFTDSETITLQIRPFSRSEDQQLVADELDRLELWAFVAAGEAPLRPEEMVVSRPCIGDDGNLRDGCTLRLLYDGALQPQRLGADLWLTLPRSYRGELDLYTEDNVTDGDYLNRGNVCVEPNEAKIAIRMRSANAFIKAGPSGQVEVLGDSTNVTVDVPPDIVSRLSASITSQPEINALCGADFDVEGAIEESASLGSEQAYVAVEAGPQPRPGPPTVSVTTRMSSCERLSSTESPAEYQSNGGETPPPRLQGTIEFCNGCLSDPCAALLPGFTD